MFFIYGTICIMSVIFTFSLETYYKIDNRLNLIVIAIPFLITIFDTIYIDWIDIWMSRHNKICGPLLIFFSLFDMQSCFNIINHFTSV